MATDRAAIRAGLAGAFWGGDFHPALRWMREGENLLGRDPVDVPSGQQVRGGPAVGFDLPCGEHGTAPGTLVPRAQTSYAAWPVPEATATRWYFRSGGRLSTRQAG